MSDPEGGAPAGRRAEALLLALVVAAAGAALALRATGHLDGSWDDPMRDALLRGEADRPDLTGDVAIVLVDDETLDRLQERWPLDRLTWAKLVRVLEGYGPSVLALDVWFGREQPSGGADLALDVAEKLDLAGLADTDAGAAFVTGLEKLAGNLHGDRQLAEALGASGRTILGAACLPERPPDLEAAGVDELRALPEPRPERVSLHCAFVSGNHAGIGLAARGQAGLDVVRDEDGRVRRYAYAFRADDGGGPWESLATAAVEIGRPDDVSWRARLAELPGAMPLLRPLSPASFETVSASDLLLAEPGSPALRARLAGRIVFVGVSARGAEDRVFGAFDEVAVPGVFVHANAAVDLLHGRHIVSGDEAASWGLALGTALLLVLVLLGRRVTSVPVLLALGATALAGWATFAWRALESGMAVPIAPVGLGIVAWLGLRLAFRFWRETLAKRRAEAQREALVVELRARNEELRESIENLRRTREAKARMESELAIGREIQLSMLPRGFETATEREDVSIHAALHPAREVGGDLYDFFYTDETHLAVSIGDVSGKGVGAALFMAMTQTLVKSHAKADPSPARVVTETNDALSQDNDQSMFVTLFYALLDTESGRLRYSNAGHNPPYVRRRDGSVERLDLRHGPVLGAMDGLEYGESETTLAPGDLLFVYTDGVTEAQDARGALYEEPRLAERLLLAPPGPKGALETVLEDVWAFQGEAEQADDVTILALQRHDVDGAEVRPPSRMLRRRPAPA